MTKMLKKYILFACLVSVFVLGFADQAFADNIFSTIVNRAGNMLKDLKIIVYILGGFGILAVSFMALFGKISWQRFSYIAFGLFLVAGMGSFIDYFVTKKGDGTEKPLTYGNYLSSLFADTAGTSDAPGGTSVKPNNDNSNSSNTGGDIGGDNNNNNNNNGASSCTDGTTNASGQTCKDGEWVSGGGQGDNVDDTAESETNQTEETQTEETQTEEPQTEEPQINEARRCESDKQCKEKAKAGEVNEYQTICYNNICMSKAEKEETKKAEKEAEKEAKKQKEKEEAEKEKAKYTCQSNDECLAKIESKTIDAKKTQCYQNKCMTEKEVKKEQKAAEKAAEEEKERKKHECKSDADCEAKAKEGIIKSNKKVCHEGQCTSKAGAYLDQYTDQVVQSGEEIIGDITKGTVNTAQGSLTGLVEAIGGATSNQLTGTISAGASALNKEIEEGLGGTVVGDVLADIVTGAVSGAATEINNETNNLVNAGEDWVEDQTSFTDYSGQNDILVDYIEKEIENQKQKTAEEETKAKAEANTEAQAEANTKAQAEANTEAQAEVNAEAQAEETRVAEEANSQQTTATDAQTQSTEQEAGSSASNSQQQSQSATQYSATPSASSTNSSETEVKTEDAGVVVLNPAETDGFKTQPMLRDIPKFKNPQTPADATNTISRGFGRQKFAIPQ